MFWFSKYDQQISMIQGVYVSSKKKIEWWCSEQQSLPIHVEDNSDYAYLNMKYLKEIQFWKCHLFCAYVEILLV